MTEAIATLPALDQRVARLARFLEKVRPLLRLPELPSPGPQRRMPAPDAVAEMLAKLKSPLRAARTHGEFIDVWAVAGLKRKEVRNAAVLAWLLDPQGSHGQGPAGLTALMGLIGRDAPEWRLEPALLERARVQTEQRPLGSERDRVDIAIEGPGYIIFVEVKIDAGQGDRQLMRYTEAALAKAVARARRDEAPLTLVVYLSPHKPQEVVDDLVHLDWREASEALHSVANRAEGYASFVIRSFANHVRTFS